MRRGPRRLRFGVHANEFMPRRLHANFSGVGPYHVTYKVKFQRVTSVQRNGPVYRDFDGYSVREGTVGTEGQPVFAHVGGGPVTLGKRARPVYQAVTETQLHVETACAAPVTLDSLHAVSSEQLKRQCGTSDANL